MQCFLFCLFRVSNLAASVVILQDSRFKKRLVANDEVLAFVAYKIET